MSNSTDKKKLDIHFNTVKRYYVYTDEDSSSAACKTRQTRLDTQSNQQQSEQTWESRELAKGKTVLNKIAQFFENIFPKRNSKTFKM
jgi:hypothetical protein